MRRLAVAIALLVGAVANASDQPDRLEQGNELLRQGNSADALGVFGQLQAEEPNAPDVLFGLGCAQYQEALRQDAKRKPEESAKLLSDAAQNFERAEALFDDPAARADAGYDRGNALAQIAKRSAADKPQDAKAAYEQSIHAYESFLQRHPDYAPAQHNLDHMRYMLKRIQQQPPPPQPQSGNKDQQQKGDQNQQQNQQQSQGNQQQQQQQQQDQGQDQKQDSQSQQQQKDQSKDSQQSQGNSSQQPQQDQQNTPDLQTQEKAENGTPPSDRQSIEALLNSLENKDKDEQKRLRDAPYDRRLTKEWW